MSAAEVELRRFRRQRKLDLMDLFSESISRKNCSRWHARKRDEQHLRNIEFRVGDMLELRFPDSHFDAVVCVFGIFFVPDMAAAARGSGAWSGQAGSSLSQRGVRVSSSQQLLLSGTRFAMCDQISTKISILGIAFVSLLQFSRFCMKLESITQKSSLKTARIRSPHPKRGGRPFLAQAIAAPSSNSMPAIANAFAQQT